MSFWKKLVLVVKKVNLFDALAVVLIVLSLALLFFVYTRPPKGLGSAVVMVVRVDKNVEVIYPQAKEGGAIFVGGTNIESRVLGASRNKEAVYIEIEGLGTKEEGLFTFNGQRTLVGQRMELRGNFWAQGIVTNLEFR